MKSDEIMGCGARLRRTHAPTHSFPPSLPLSFALGRPTSCVCSSSSSMLDTRLSMGEGYDMSIPSSLDTCEPRCLRSFFSFASFFFFFLSAPRAQRHRRARQGERAPTHFSLGEPPGESGAAARAELRASSPTSAAAAARGALEGLGDLSSDQSSSSAEAGRRAELLLPPPPPPPSASRSRRASKLRICAAVASAIDFARPRARAPRAAAAARASSCSAASMMA